MTGIVSPVRGGWISGMREPIWRSLSARAPASCFSSTSRKRVTKLRISGSAVRAASFRKARMSSSLYRPAWGQRGRPRKQQGRGVGPRLRRPAGLRLANTRHQRRQFTEVVGGNLPSGTQLIISDVRRDGPCHLTNTAERGKFMPRSKHRRKPGGKAVAHPGRGKTRELPLSPEDVLWRRFVDGYTRPFHEKYGDSTAGSAGDMLDLIEEGAFVATGSGRLQPVSKAAVFREFMAPLDLDEEIAARDAEVALAFLVEQGMVEVAGDTITVPARFWSGGQVPAT